MRTGNLTLLEVGGPAFKYSKLNHKSNYIQFITYYQRLYDCQNFDSVLAVPSLMILGISLKFLYKIIIFTILMVTKKNVFA